MLTSLRLTPLALILALPPADPQAPVITRVSPTATARVVSPTAQVKALLLPPGKTQGSFHLNGLVRPDGKSIVLRWANTHGEMPTEGVTLYRMRLNERSPEWKLVNKKPVQFFRGDKAKDRIKAMRPESRNRLMSLFHSDLQYDPATKLRMARQPAADAKVKLNDLTPEKVADQFVKLRSSGRLAKSDMLALHARADSDAEAAEVLGLAYTDTPGKGQWRYKIVVKLPEGGSVEAACAKTFDVSTPTPVPTVTNLSAQSGNGKVLLNWDAPPSDIITGYHVYRAETVAGPWKKLTTSPVKVVKVEAEDPELSMQKALARGGAVEKEMKRNVGAPMTESKVREIQLAAREAAAMPGALPALSPALSTQIRDGVKSGRIPGAGPVSALSIYSDDRRAAGNGDLLNDHPYVYRVTTVDIAGFETSPDAAPLISGTPKDLDAPRVPGKPMLKAESDALGKLRGVQSARLQDPVIKDLNLALAAKQPMAPRDLSPLLKASGQPIPAATPAAPAAPAYLATTSLGQVKQLRASRLLATFPTQEMAAVAKASQLTSGADGSIPPAQLVWEASPDPDLKSYEVYRASGKGPLLKVASTPTPGWTDTGLEVGQSYRYAITAVDQRGNESEHSGEGVIEVCDGLLKAKLAVSGVVGKSTTAVLASAPGRKLMRPAGWVMKHGDLKLLKATAAPVKLASGIATGPVAAFKVPKSAKAPVANSPKGLGLGMAPAPKGSALVAGKVDATALKAVPNLKASARLRAPIPNLMLVEPAHPKEIQVQLEWARPTQGNPTEYVVYQAPQKTEWKSVPRPAMGISKAFSTKGVPTSGLALAPGALAALAPSPAGGITLKPGAIAAAATLPSAKGITVISTPELHALASQRRVATSGSGLRVAPARKDHRASLVSSVGPGEFTKVNDGQVTTERYAITFAADVAQYGGTSFYYRIQARTLEFGRWVEGPLSEAIEVQLPDVVAPPAPETSALDLQQGSADNFNVALSWSHLAARDSAGCVVDRQSLAFTVVDGEAKPGAPAGEAKRLTPKPIQSDPVLGADAYLDQDAPGGYQRYTIRAVDKVGNISEPKGALDVWIPGEARPDAPTGLAIAGGRLTWAAVSNARGYSVWRSFTGAEEDYEQISPLLDATEVGFNLPPQGTLHLKVVSRSATGMHQAVSVAVVRTP
ncbi:MAG: fibronectin type III domain-containing protein [Acidobacteria bacterium]|nr:fibronectin type III domain-containing protein [Acidobacteriota bacterium]